jgi:hypothetical protein
MGFTTPTKKVLATGAIKITIEQKPAFSRANPATLPPAGKTSGAAPKGQGPIV